MKPTVYVLAALLPLLVDPILDTNDNLLRPSVEYYIRPGFTNVAGGITLVGHNGSCPLRFFPGDADDNDIELEDDFNVEVQATIECTQSTVWKIELDDRTKR
ncbi:miraculin-like [Canna indica]|uniref:Miraculin-like n=1 Tax=Canna indica TaxID=4628 RepID=A0AAQ3KB12_9LILI|nr:miraculin-like [Canna indica]